VAAGNTAAALGQNKAVDPLSQLVAAGVLLQTGKATDAVSEAAVNTASAQGWRRPLLTWLGLQLRQAGQGGRADEVARLQRRIALVDGTRATTQPTPSPKALP